MVAGSTPVMFSFEKGYFVVSLFLMCAVNFKTLVFSGSSIKNTSPCITPAYLQDNKHKHDKQRIITDDYTLVSVVILVRSEQ